MSLVGQWNMQDANINGVVAGTVGGNASTVAADTIDISIAGPGGPYPLALNVANVLNNTIVTPTISYSSSQAASVACWVKFASTTPTMLIWESSPDVNSETDAFYFATVTTSGGLITPLIKGNVGTNSRRYALPTTGVWALYVTTFNMALSGSSGGESRMYVNGAEPSVSSTTNSNNTNTIGDHEMYFGSRGGVMQGADAAYAGAKVYNHVLSAAEIAALVEEVFPVGRHHIFPNQRNRMFINSILPR